MKILTANILKKHLILSFRNSELIIGKFTSGKNSLN